MSNSIIENLEKIVKSLEAEQANQLKPTATAKVEQTVQANTTDKFNATITKSTEFKITLNPEHLGKVTVQMVTNGNKMSVLITAATDTARDLLLARAHSVRVMVELSGVTVERYEVVSNQPNHTVTAAEQAQKDIYDSEREKENEKNQKEQEQNQDENQEAEVSFAEIVEQMQML